jgi:hypothetical protein
MNLSTTFNSLGGLAEVTPRSRRVPNPFWRPLPLRSDRLEATPKGSFGATLAERVSSDERLLWVDLGRPIGAAR